MPEGAEICCNVALLRGCQDGLRLRPCVPAVHSAAGHTILTPRSRVALDGPASGRHPAHRVGRPSRFRRARPCCCSFSVCLSLSPSLTIQLVESAAIRPAGQGDADGGQPGGGHVLLPARASVAAVTTAQPGTLRSAKGLKERSNVSAGLSLRLDHAVDHAVRGVREDAACVGTGAYLRVPVDPTAAI